MRNWLVIWLQAPLASFGDSPGNALRGTANMPTRSALIGLAAAALGVEREDAARQHALSRHLVTAAGLYEPGTPLRDFHTYQSLHQAAKGAATRAEALANGDYLQTSISERHYRADGLWHAAYRLKETGDESVTLEALKKAFEMPGFLLYLGRKSCPLSHPLVPRIVEAENVVAAFHAHYQLVAKTVLHRGGQLQVVSVEDVSDGPMSNRGRRNTRQDDPRDRSTRWTFGERAEWRFPILPQSAKGKQI